MRKTPMITQSCKRGGLGLLAAFLVSASGALAQQDAGLLGKQYAGISFFSENVRHFDVGTGYGAGVLANFPVATNLDAQLTASHERFGDVSLTDNRLFASLVGYQQLESVKVFADLSLGGTWQSIKISGADINNSDGIYGVGVGVEAPIATRTAITGRVGYSRYFDNDNGDYWTFSLGLNHWVNDKFGVFATVSAIDDDSTVFTIGAHVRF